MKKTKTQPINPADVASTPTQGTRPQSGKDSTDSCDALSKSQINRLSRQAPGNATERDPKKLRNTKLRQFGSNGFRAN